MPTPRRPRFLSVLMSVIVGLGFFLLVPSAAHAAPGTVSGGRLDWAIKNSFQTYITGPIARGSWTLVDGAGTAGGSNFRFHSANGTYDSDSGHYNAAYRGGVRFQGHPIGDGTFELDMTILNPRVELTNGSGRLYVDITTQHAGTSNSVTNVNFATLDVAGLDPSGAGTSLSLFDVPAVLTAEGASAFEGYYAEGTPLDPVSFSGDIKAPSPDKSSDKTTSDDRKKGEVAGAIVDWGVKRTWREFVSGDIAQGGWELSDGAADGGAIFRFLEGEGTWNEEKKTLAIKYDGAITFTGADVDVTLSEFAVSVKKNAGTLTATVTNSGTTTESVAIVTFDAEALSVENEVLILNQAATELTKDGSAAFNSLYPEGAAMDPITIAVPLTDDAVVPALPDLGEEPVVSPTSSNTDTAVGTESSSSVWLWIVAAGIALALVGAGLYWLRKHQERSLSVAGASVEETTDTADSGSESDDK